MRFLLLGLIIFLSACSRNGSLIPPEMPPTFTLPEMSLQLVTLEDVSLNSNLLEELGIENSGLTTVLKQSVTHGTLSIDKDGALIFNPPVEYSGDQDFLVEFFIDNKSLGTKSVSIKTISVDDSPIAISGALNLSEDDLATSGVLQATDVDSSILTYSLVSQGSKGTVVITDSSTGAFSYEPYPNANGLDTFTYQVSDGNSLSNIATVTLNILAINDSPTAQNISLNVTESVPYNFSLLGADIDGDTLTYTIVSPANGSLVCVNGSCEYTSLVDALSDSFTYEVSDGFLTDSATVSISIDPTNNAPVAVDLTLNTNEDTPVIGQIVATDSDSVSLTYVIVTQPSHGSVSLNASNGSLTYTPGLNYFGSDSFTFKVSDGSAESLVRTASVVISSVNDVPTAQNDSVNTEQNTAVAISLLGSDVESSLNYVIETSPSHGSLSGVPPNLTYTPHTNYKGADSFTFKVNDGAADSNIATVSISVADNGDWFNSNWAYRRVIPLDNELFSVSSNYYVVELSGDFNYAHAKADGSDLRVVDKNGIQRAHYVDGWNVDGKSYVRFNASPSPHSGSDYVWLYYGNMSAGSNSSYVDSNAVAQFSLTDNKENLSGTTGVISGSTVNASRLGYSRKFNNGVSNESFTFPGTALNFSSDLSIEVMLTVDTSSAQAYVVHQPSGGGEEYSLIVDGLTPKFSLRGVVVNSSVDLSLNESALITATYDSLSQSCRIYVNGSLTGSGVCSTPLTHSTDNIVMANDSSLNHAFKGSLDEVRFYNEVLSVESVKAHYASLSLNSVLGSEESKGDKHYWTWLSVNDDANDGMIDSSLHVQGINNSNEMGIDSGSVLSYFRFENNVSIPTGAMITKSVLKLMNTGQGSWTGTQSLSVVAEKVSNSSVVNSSTDYPGGSTGPLATINALAWGFPSGLKWDRGFNSVEVSNITQELVDSYAGLNSGNHITFWVQGLWGSGFVKTSDFSDNKKVPAKLFIQWQEGQ